VVRLTVCSKCGGPREVNRRCVPCERKRQAAWKRANPDKANAQQRRQWAKHKGLKRKYGITREDYDALVVAQEGRCAICGKVPDRLHVDHHHGTGLVRGLLCFVCNTRLAVVEDTAFVDRALAYLAR
jgi:hypothetical protein